MTTIDDVRARPAPRPVEHDRPCVICRRATSQRTYRTCGACSTSVLTMLDEIGDLYAEQVLDPDSVLPAAGASGESSTSKTYRSSAPTSLRRIDLTDERPDIDGRARGVRGTLLFWSDAVREGNNLPARLLHPRCVTAAAFTVHTVHTELAFLASYWWWIRAHQAAARFNHQMQQIRNELLDLAQERAGLVRIGRCAGSGGASCGHLLMVRIGDRAVTCPACSTRWTADRWDELAAVQNA
jgi:hypothetical protein